jgi:hypothetical protein
MFLTGGKCESCGEYLSPNLDPMHRDYGGGIAQCQRCKGWYCESCWGQDWGEMCEECALVDAVNKADEEG